MKKRRRVIKKVPKKTVKTDKTSCIGGMCEPQRTQGLKAPAPKGTYNLIDISGPGLFLAAHVTKQGGATGLSFVRLEIDGRSVVNLSFAAAMNWGLTQQNPYGLVVLGSGGLQNFTIGWPVPLTFKRGLRLSIVVKEAGVVQIVANVIRGSIG